MHLLKSKEAGYGIKGDMVLSAPMTREDASDKLTMEQRYYQSSSFALGNGSTLQSPK